MMTNQQETEIQTPPDDHKQQNVPSFNSSKLNNRNPNLKLPKLTKVLFHNPIEDGA